MRQINAPLHPKSAYPDWSGVADFLGIVGRSEIAQQKKDQLLEMAKNGDDRLSNRTQMGSALGSYIRPDQGSYDPVFDKQIRKLRPDWFIKSSDTQKDRLLHIAKKGSKKPNVRTVIGGRLFSYTNPNNICYDKDFDKKIRALRPDWFVTQFDTAQQKKNQLLKMARNGEDRPNKKTELGVSLSNYARDRSKSYDPGFTTQLTKIRPDWFVTQFNKCQDKKDQIIDMAKNGEDKPRFTDELGGLLSRCTRHSNRSYDRKFDRKIRKIRPDWFITQSDISQQNKDQLLELAKNGGDRPTKRLSRLGAALCSYTCRRHGCYDQDFDAKIRKLRPDWFR